MVSGQRLGPDGVESSLLRLNADGSLDPSFEEAIPLSVTPRTAGLRWMVRADQFLPATFANRADAASIFTMLYDERRQRLLVAGDFSHIGSEPRSGLEAFGMRAPRRYRDWAAAMLPAELQGPEVDVDGDGASNLQEFAVGSDPRVADQPPGLEVEFGESLSFWIAVEDGLEGVEYEMELSENLRDWRVADASEVILTREPDRRIWRLNPARGALFGRIRFIESSVAP
jgi:hypothetical protein